MQIGPSRRLFLKLAAAGLAFGPAAAFAQPLPLLRQWQTGNSLLRPLTLGDGRIYFCGDAELGALDPARDEPVWTQPAGLGGPAAFRPRFWGGRVLFGSQRALSMRDAASGASLWSYQARIQAGTPLLTAGGLYLGDGNEITALDAASGGVRWRFSGIADTLASYAPVLAGGALLCGPGDGRLYALSAETGKLLWQTDHSAAWQYLRQLHVDGDVLVAGSYKEKLFGISVRDGKILWEFNAGNFINSHHVADGAAYLWSPTGWIYALDAASGNVRWRAQTTDYDDTAGNWGPLMAELVTLDGTLLALDMRDELHVLDLHSGKEIRRSRLPSPVRHAVLPIAGGLAFPAMDGRVLLTGIS